MFPSFTQSRACGQIQSSEYPQRECLLQLSENLMFVRTFLRSPKMIGSAVPSSRFLISKLFRHFEWKKAAVVVEFGPGVGNITRQMLQQLPSDAKLLAMETN